MKDFSRKIEADLLETRLFHVEDNKKTELQVHFCEALEGWNTTDLSRKTTYELIRSMFLYIKSYNNETPFPLFRNFFILSFFCLFLFNFTFCILILCVYFIFNL